MKNSILLFLLLFTITSQAQMLNDTPFNANVVHPKFKKGYGPKILIDAGHHNFVVELGLNKPLFDVASSDGYQIKIDSMQFTKEYLSNYNIVVIWPAMPFKFGSKNQVTDEITFTTDELNALHDWVSNGGSLLMFSEHAPIDKSVTPLFNKFGIQLSTGIVVDSLNSDTPIEMPSWKYSFLKFTSKNGLLNTEHPITKGEKKNERISNILTIGGSGLTGDGYTNILKLSSSAMIKKWNGTMPSGTPNSQCLAGNVGKGKLAALGDCNGFTAMSLKSGGYKLSAGMQVSGYDWKQFVLNTLHWLSL
ncbi:hypothetical protein [Flavobacterium sp.]|uniref:hypothetical protein n=1 Tax=Flavobacterium sp. TaxID=239 RepID=UPI0038FC71EF